MANDAALQAVMTEHFARRTALEWEADLAAAGVPAGKVRPITDTMELDQLKERDLFLDLADGSRILNAGFRFAHDGPGVDAPAPALGADTDAVLRRLKQST